MPELELLDTRRISGKGVLKVPEVAFKYRYYLLYLDLLRIPSNRYMSLDWNPPRSLYARLTFRSNGYSVGTDSMEFEKQSFVYVNDTSGQALIAIKCAYEGILQSFVNLIGGMSGTPGGVGIFVTGVTNFVEPMTSLNIGWDEVLFKCYSSTAIMARFYGLKYVQCGEQEPDIDRPPPPPPPPFPPLPPDAVIDDISPPYDPGTDDDGNTQPFPEDSIDEEIPLPGEECVLYDVVFRVVSSGLAGGGILDVALVIYGTLDEVGTENNGGSLFAYYIARGDESTGCLESPTKAFLTSVSTSDLSVEVLSFTLH